MHSTLQQQQQPPPLPPQGPPVYDRSDDMNIEQRDVYLYIDKTLPDTPNIVQVATDSNGADLAHQRMVNIFGSSDTMWMTTYDENVLDIGADIKIHHSIAVLVDHVAQRSRDLPKLVGIITGVQHAPDCRMLIAQINTPGDDQAAAGIGKLFEDATGGRLRYKQTHVGVVQPEYAWIILERAPDYDMLGAKMHPVSAE